MRRALQLLLRRLAPERGIALIMALGVSVVLGATVTTAIAYTSSSFRQTTSSKADQVALSLAESGLNIALSQLHSSGNPGMAGALPTEAGPGERAVPGVGRAQWYGTLADNVWTVVGVGLVPNPSPQLSDVMRRVTARVRLGSATQGSGNNAVWNYVYADDISACTTLSNSVNVNVPLYIRGDLCVQNQAKVTSYALQVGGKVSFSNSASVGEPGAPIAEAHIGGGCQVDGGAVVKPCGPSQRVHATVSDDRTTGLTKPPVDLEYWYQNSKPGPRQGCTAGSFPGGFDNDLVRNGSLPDVDLTPSNAYDCRVYDANGLLVGQISWTGGPSGTLTIAGTIYLDGNVEMQNLNLAVYDGRATIYATGSITLRNHSKLCGVAACDATWQPTQDLLAFVAGTDVVIDNFSTFQGAVYAVRDYREGNNAKVWGPIVANRIFLQNSTENHYVPIGTLLPGMPATYEDAVTLTNEPGSWGS
jgi:Tfp pilus assembly protein PilX